jgi:hypothetical protein
VVCNPKPGRRIYRTAAIMTFALLVILILLGWVGQIPDSLLPWIKLLLFLGVLGTAITFVGMEYFLFSFDSSSALTKVFWFCLMLLPLLGPPLYCFIVYSRAEPFRDGASADDASSIR